MIEKREETSKDAPTEEVKNNVMKIYSEVTSSGVFSSLTQGIRGMFSSRRSAASDKDQRVGHGCRAPDAPSTNAVAIRSFASFKNFGQGSSLLEQLTQQRVFRTTQDLLKTSVPDTYKEAKSLLTKIRRSCDQWSERSASISRYLRTQFELEVNRLLQKIVLLFKLDIQKDPDAIEDLRWLKNWAVKTWSNDAMMRLGLYTL